MSTDISRSLFPTGISVDRTAMQSSDFELVAKDLTGQYVTRTRPIVGQDVRFGRSPDKPIERHPDGNTSNQTPFRLIRDERGGAGELLIDRLVVAKL